MSPLCGQGGVLPHALSSRFATSSTAARFELAELAEFQLFHLLAVPGGVSALHVFTWGDVAALPVGWPGSPGAQVVRHSLVGTGVHTLHTPGLEAIVAAGCCAQGPQADPPVHTAGLRPAVLGAHRPWNGTALLRW